MTTRAPHEIEAQFRKAVALHRQGAVAEAVKLYQDILLSAPQHVETLHLLGVAALQAGQHQRGVDLISRALVLKPDHAEALSNLGNGLKALGRLDEALARYDAALVLKPAMGEALFNRAQALMALQRPAEALAGYDAAMTVDSRYATAQTFLDRAIALSALGRASDALECIGEALKRDPGFIPALAWRGFLYMDMKRLADARDDFERVLKSGAEPDFVRGYCLHTKMQLCDWRDFDAEVTGLFTAVEAGARASHPFPLLAMADRPDVHRRCAELFSPPEASHVSFARRSGRTILRIGYFSSDFHDHPVSHLAAPMLEHHDRARFEIVAYGMGRKRDGWTARVKAGVDRYIDASGWSVAQIAEHARAADLDIAVDLSGHTANNRTGVFAARVAPVQMSYLGYLGSMGASYMDYLVADAVIVPVELRRQYSEKIITLPWYQCNDAVARSPTEEVRRAKYGLADDAFVFASFNNAFKITPDVFAGWVRILKRAPRSVLWIFAEGEAAKNLAREATLQGVDPRRLVFADKAPMDEHLARQRLADIFLDTFPYNAGATASAALRAGLPVLTRRGLSFASRMGASLLTSLGLEALVADSAQAYEDVAMDLAHDAPRVAALKRQLVNSSAGALFDPAAFTTHIEAAYEAAHARWLSGQAPDHIAIA